MGGPEGAGAGALYGQGEVGATVEQRTNMGAFLPAITFIH